jgi:hypothetical protein
MRGGAEAPRGVAGQSIAANSPSSKRFSDYRFVRAVCGVAVVSSDFRSPGLFSQLRDRLQELGLGLLQTSD